MCDHLQFASRKNVAVAVNIPMFVCVCVCVCVHAPAHACVCSLLYAVDSPCVWQLRQGNTILCQRHAGHSNCNIPSSYLPPEPYLVAALCPHES